MGGHVGKLLQFGIGPRQFLGVAGQLLFRPPPLVQFYGQVGVGVSQFLGALPHLDFQVIPGPAQRLGGSLDGVKQAGYR